MFRKLIIATAALVAAAVPAAAATFTVTFVGSPTTVPGNNDFVGDLAALGLTGSVNGTITISGPSRVRVEFLGSESGFTNQFTLGAVTGTESDGNNFAAPIVLGTAIVAGGSVSPAFFSNGGAFAYTPGSSEFAVYTPTLSTTSPYTSSSLVFGFDDNTGNPDDNHDDFIVRVTAVPEASTWVMMIAGFGLVGFAARRRSTTTTITA